MLTKNIFFKNFEARKSNNKIKEDLTLLIKEKNEIIKSLGASYKNNYYKKTILRLKKQFNIRIIGIGGSILGAIAIFSFLRNKIKKKVEFISNLNSNHSLSNKKYVNLIISKSGNTLETITNSNILIKKKDINIFVTENKKNYLSLLAQKLKSEVINHNNYIGGRYSVLSEVGMLPAELMGLNIRKFKQMNNIIKNKKFINLLTANVSSTIYLIKKKKFNSIILNYDEKSDNLFKWYQQLIAESLGKKGNGILPIVSTMPKDNHSVMQHYLDGTKNNFFTFFFTKEKNSPKINNNEILSTHLHLKNKNINQIMYAQKAATEKIFSKRNIPFRSFEIINRNEETLGELFCFFILETILLGRALKINPYDQPSVELIKKETKKNLL
jgi:glucose-6-phosphate isomerase